MGKIYDNDTLKELADKAKEKLIEQGELVDNVQVDPNIDLYDGLADEAFENMSVYNEESVNYDIQEYGENIKEYNENDEINIEELEEEIEKLPLYDDLIFPGGPPKSMITQWKKQWEGYEICIAEILGDMFVFRTLDRFEYKQICALKNLDALLREELICETVTLWPENYECKNMARKKAGIPSTYSEVIMERSGFTNQIAVQVI